MLIQIQLRYRGAIFTLAMLHALTLVICLFKHLLEYHQLHLGMKGTLEQKEHVRQHS